MNRYWLFLLALAGVAAGVSSAAPVASAAATYYASPSGSGSICSEAAPCSIKEAAEKAEDGDAVVLKPGHYALNSAVGLYKNIQFGGSAGPAATVVETTSAHNIYAFGEAAPTIHDLTIEGQGGLVINGGRGERIYVNFTGGASSGCSLGIGGELVDSVCWSHGSGPYGIEAEASGEEGTIVLRNDTVISSEDDAIFMQASSSAALKVEGVNVIARGTGEPDLYADFSGFSTVEAIFKNSDYGSVEQFPPFTKVTDPGTNGNITAVPSFVDAAGGNFAEPSGAPTIDLGANDPANGERDILGNARMLPTCVGGTAVTDIGAYEFVPTASCSSSTPPPAPKTPSNAFKLGKVVRNTKKGTAKLFVSVPNAGALTLSGKGAKKVSLSSKGAVTLKLPVVATGKAKAQLAAKGKAKLKLTLKFSPSGGTVASQVKKVTLIKKRG